MVNLGDSRRCGAIWDAELAGNAKADEEDEAADVDPCEDADPKPSVALLVRLLSSCGWINRGSVCPSDPAREVLANAGADPRVGLNPKVGVLLPIFTTDPDPCLMTLYWKLWYVLL